jgi:hypothetical protein
VRNYSIGTPGKTLDDASFFRPREARVEGVITGLQPKRAWLGGEKHVLIYANFEFLSTLPPRKIAKKSYP